VNDLPRDFILFSRIGQTDSNFHDLHGAGRLDIVHECIVSSLFLSHGLRRDVTFHAILNGPPTPPIHIQIDGETLYDVRTDMDTWQVILKKTLQGKPHPGIIKDKTSFEALVKARAKTRTIYAKLSSKKTAFLSWATTLGYPKKLRFLPSGLEKKLALEESPT
jgi:tRNA pseudouridine-54 N-methylase